MDETPLDVCVSCVGHGPGYITRTLGKVRVSNPDFVQVWVTEVRGFYPGLCPNKGFLTRTYSQRTLSVSTGDRKYKRRRQ